MVVLLFANGVVEHWDVGILFLKCNDVSSDSRSRPGFQRALIDQLLNIIWTYEVSFTRFSKQVLEVINAALSVNLIGTGKFNCLLNSWEIVLLAGVHDDELLRALNGK